MNSTAKWLLILSLTWGSYLTVLFANMLSMKPDGLYAGHPYVWADWALHIGMANIFAHNEPSDWFKFHPVYAGAQLNYPFLTNLVSGLLMRAGSSVEFAFLAPSILYSWMIIFGLFFFFNVLLANPARAYLAVSLFFFSSGFGFLNFLKDWLASGDWHIWIYPKEEYSRFMEYGWGSGNVLVGLLVPQRAFLLGLAFAIWSLTVYLAKFGSRIEIKNRTLVAGGVLGGLLAITHVHSLMALGIIFLILGVFFIRRWKEQMFFAVPMILTAAAFHFAYLRGAVNTSNFWVWNPGWTSHTIDKWIIQWAWQWGLTIPAAIVGMIFLKREAGWKLVTVASFFLLFALGNLFRFQPVDWDNSKIFLWSYIGLSGASAYLVGELWAKKLAGKIIASALTVTLAFTGVLEISRLVQTWNHSHRMISIEDMTFAETVRSKTDASDVFLTGTAHDHPIMVWAARPLFMGYTSWVFNYGFPFEEREKEMVKMFAGDEELLRKNQISYVVIDWMSNRQFKINSEYFSKFPVAFQTPQRQVIDTRSLWKN